MGFIDFAQTDKKVFIYFSFTLYKYYIIIFYKNQKRIFYQEIFNPFHIFYKYYNIIFIKNQLTA